MEQLIRDVGDLDAFRRCLDAIPEEQARAIARGDIRDADGKDILQHAVLQVQIPVIKYLLEDLGCPIDHADAVRLRLNYNFHMY